MEHEVAKLIGAPPGYLGHRETQPLLTQQKLNAVTSERSNLSIVLFDEIEKSAPSMARLLLGVLDKGSLRLGDNTHVNFERSLIFLTSNLGAREMASFLKPSFGFGSGPSRTDEEVADKLQNIGMAAVRRKFAPEFVNRIDAVLTYQPLSRQTLDGILEIQLAEIQKHIHRRLGVRAFNIDVTRGARRFLLDLGCSPESGARELKRTLHRQIVHRLGTMLTMERVPPRSTVRIDLSRDRSELKFRVVVEPVEEADPPIAA